jgi:hypothetical protein
MNLSLSANFESSKFDRVWESHHSLDRVLRGSMQERAKSLAIGVGTHGWGSRRLRPLPCRQPATWATDPWGEAALLVHIALRISSAAFIWLRVLHDLPQTLCERDRAGLGDPAPTLVDIAEGE